LTEVVEESKRKGTIYAPFNSTFIALIPKKEVPTSFEDLYLSPYVIVSTKL